MRLGVGVATQLIATAIARGCDTRSLMALARWYERSQRQWPRRWAKPSTVLMIRLQRASPRLPAWAGWIPGSRDKPVRSRPHRPVIDRQALELRRLQCRELVAAGPSMVEMLRELERAHA